MKRYVGQTYHEPGGDYYILAQVNRNEVALISLASGNRWANPTKVKNPGRISHEEWLEISDDHLKFEQVHLEFEAVNYA